MSTASPPVRAGGPGAESPTRWQRLRGELSLWRPLDLVGVAAAWAVGLLLIVVAAALIIYMGFRGLQYLSLDMLVSRPQAGAEQADTGGILDPMIGTLLIVFLATAIALPLAVGAALWIVEYGRPRWLARVVE
jgi:phosphate transport system permease protein